ncbi:quinoprotein dehydrogenase-associated putative ABC transporter substrate-binding protein [Caenispirillum bisanense]|uniref:quinoprotein dehydrogenase-associated putative ABC transporter substrate-binding protein n=1 Tax=Caenispirillum bisanense TaxID=414052 RepID=UPI0031E20919
MILTLKRSAAVALTAAAAVLAAVVAQPGPARAAAETWMPSGSLRVCADGALLPYSDERGEGFENRIAEMIGADLGLPVTYYWWPQTIGFVRNTLRARHCDLIIGAAVGEELMQNTNPYYRSAYVMVYRRDSGLTATGLDDPGLRGARIGVVAQTPPATLLRRHGLTNIEPYQLNVDTRVEQPVRQAVEDVARRRTDLALLWGPMAAWHAARAEVPLTVVPLADAPSARMQFMISMGLREGETRWKHWLNEFITRRQADIDAVLTDYHVPLMNRDGTPRQPAAATATAAAPAEAAAVPEPDGYRMDAFRAPTPTTLQGATVVGLQEVIALMKQGAPLIDVLPAPPRPADLAAGTDWLPPPRATIPGATWLPNVGFGTLSDDMAGYFRRHLERLTGGDAGRAVVLFCERDCWMSWNAARRAVDWGYGRVHWFPGGTTEWGEAGLPLIPVAPAEGLLN